MAFVRTVKVKEVKVLLYLSCVILFCIVIHLKLDMRLPTATFYGHVQIIDHSKARLCELAWLTRIFET